MSNLILGTNYENEKGIRRRFPTSAPDTVLTVEVPLYIIHTEDNIGQEKDDSLISWLHRLVILRCQSCQTCLAFSPEATHNKIKNTEIWNTVGHVHCHLRQHNIQQDKLEH